MNNRILSCSAQVQTDSLSVFLDLSRLSDQVAESFLRIFPSSFSASLSGNCLHETSLQSFQESVAKEYQQLSKADGVEFATIVSAFFHECKHTHDMRATRIGAELLLSELQTYGGISRLIEELKNWRIANDGASIPLPIISKFELFDDQFASTIRDLADRRATTTDWWNKPSGVSSREMHQTLPGFSIRSLFETSGYYVQLEWLFRTFGPEVASMVNEAICGDNPATDYSRPLYVLMMLLQARGINHEPDVEDLSWLIFFALNCAGIHEAFDQSTKVTKDHPGTWFDQFCSAYSSMPLKSHYQQGENGLNAVETVFRNSGLTGQSIYESASQQIESRQKEVMQRMFSMNNNESILIATEIATDFREMQRIIFTNREYHHPLGYIHLLLSGNLRPVHVWVRNKDKSIVDFLTASIMTGNHIGGHRFASKSSAQTTLLLSGRSIGRKRFFDDYVFKELTSSSGHNLKFRLVR